MRELQPGAIGISLGAALFTILLTGSEPDFTRLFVGTTGYLMFGAFGTVLFGYYIPAKRRIDKMLLAFLANNIIGMGLFLSLYYFVLAD